MALVRSFIIISFLGVLLASIYSHFSNTESYLNYMSHSQMSRDFDKDGDTERSSNHTPEMLKLVQPMVIFTAVYVMPITDFNSHELTGPVFTDSAIQSQFIQSIFRPPILA